MDNKDLELYNRRKQTVYEFICDDDYPPMKFKEMCTFLQVPGDERQTFLDILNDLTEEGLIIRSAKGRYQKVGEGTYKGHTREHLSAIREVLDLSALRA